MAPSARFSYPIALDLGDASVLVVGGGPVAARKVDGLLAAGAAVTVVAIVVSEQLDREQCAAVHERAFRPADVDGAKLVITATGDVDVDRDVAAVCRARNIWVNAADQPVDCDFILPAITRAGRLTASVSTDGASPALAGALRDRIASIVTEDVAAFAEEVAAMRAAVQARGESTEDIDWRPMIRARLAELLDTPPTG